MRKIRRKMAEKSQNADSWKEIKEKRKDNTTTERSSDFVGRPLINKKEKTIKQQKGLPTLSADLNERAMEGYSNHKYQF